MLETFQSLPDWIKALCVITPTASMLTLAALLMRFRAELKRAERGLPRNLVYSVHYDDSGHFRIVSHVPQIERQPPVLLLDTLACEPLEREQGT